MPETKVTMSVNLQRGFSNAELLSIIRKASDVSSLNRFIKRPGDKLALEIAIDNCDREKKGLKKHPFKSQLRARSTSDISTVIKRTQIEFLPPPFLHFALVNYFTHGHSDLLVDFLGHVGIKCDSSGKINGDFKLEEKYKEPSALTPLLSELVEKYGAKIVFQYLVTLHAIDSQFTFITEYFDWLENYKTQPETVVEAPEATIEIEPDASEAVFISRELPDAVVDISSDPTTRHWNKLCTEVESLLSSLRLGVIRDPATCLTVWQSLYIEVRTRQTEVGLDESSSLAQLKYAESEARYLAAANILKRVQLIKETDPGYLSAVETVKREADSLINALSNGGLQTYASKIDVFSSLLLLVENGKHGWTPQQIQDLYKLLDKELGSAVALGAILGGFVVGEAEDPPLISHLSSTVDEARVISDEQSSSTSVLIEADSKSTQTEKLSQIKSDAIKEDESTVSTSLDDSKKQHIVDGVAPSGSDDIKIVERNVDVFFSPRKFAEFNSRHWVGLSAQVEPAPWLSSNFSNSVNIAVEAMLSEENLASVYILQTAVENLGNKPTFATTSILDSADILQGGLPKPRASRVPDINDDSGMGVQKKMLLTIEALAPGDDLWSHQEIIQNVIRLTSFSNQVLSRTVAALLNAAANQVSLISHLRKRLSALENVNSNGGVLPIERLLESFRDTYTSLKSSSIRGLRTEHCRTAWKAFLDAYAAPIAKLILGKRSEKIDVDSLQPLAESLEKNAESLFEQWEAKFEDRAKMDRDVRELSLKISSLIRLIRDTRQTNASSDSIARFDLPSISEFNVFAAEQLVDETENFCRTLIFSLAAVKDSTDPLTLTQRDLLKRPELALHLGLSEPLKTSTFKFDVRKLPMERVLPAAAVILQPPYDVPSDAEISQVLKDRLSGIHRLDVMSMYLGDQAINAGERARLQRQFRDNGVERADAAFEQLEAAWVECDAIGSNRAVEIRTLLDEAKIILDAVETASFGQTAILIAWIEEATTFCIAETDRVAEKIRKDIELNAPERLEKVEYAIKNRRFWELDTSLDSDVHQKIDEARWVEWRLPIQDEPSVFPERIREIASATGGELLELVESWFNVNPTEEARRACRRFFYNFISGEMSALGSPKRRTKQQAPFEREIKTSRIVIDCLSVLQMLEHEGHNPTFVPQLNSFKSIVILSVPLSLRAAGSPSTLATFVNSELHKDEGSAIGNLAVVLTPMLSSSMRDDILDEFQRRQKAFAAVLIDDNDLYRLMSQGGAPLSDIRPFLEVILEQLPLGNSFTSPYSSQDGQHIRREMFVGREDEATKLATTSDYSRVFSGRKLGKSAFLKSVARNFDGHSLPSKNALHVLFISIAGGDSESYIEGRVVTELQTRFPSIFEVNSPQIKFGLIASIDHIIKTLPKVSLLLLLDEADSFVEEQLRSYDRNREKCLSFKLMKEVSQHTDQNDLPRVRVVFSGYRVTNTREGAWANAGGVLILSPLEIDEATNLIERPLARLGIDVSSQSRFIAKRCGNQPAILNRFGDTLIKYLRNTKPLSRKHMVKVESSHVGAAFNDPSIAAEIRTVMFNNFQGDAAGQVIFASTLLAFSKLAPGLELSNAPAAILEQITLVDPNLDWLEKRDPSLVGEIEHYLHDFEDRLLIKMRPVTGAVFCRLKVGHSMPILLAGDLPSQIRRAIGSLRDEQSATTSPLRCVFPDAQLDALRKAFKGDSTTVVVTGNWPNALQDRRVGIPDRLGIGPSLVADVGEDDSDTIGLINVNSASLEEILSRTPNKYLIVGGTDIVRRMLQLRSSNSLDLVHWQSLARVPELGIKWWFEQLRMLHFEFSGASREITKLTGQIPLLLKLFDDLMTKAFAEEADVSQVKFTEVVDKFNGSLQTVALELLNGGPNVQLEKREIEVLILICAMTKEYETLRYPEDFTEELWQDTAAAKSLRIIGPRDGDTVVVELLSLLGLIKIDPILGISYDAGNPDPIFLLADQLSNVL